MQKGHRAHDDRFSVIDIGIHISVESPAIPELKDSGSYHRGRITMVAYVVRNHRSERRASTPSVTGKERIRDQDVISFSRGSSVVTI